MDEPAKNDDDWNVPETQREGRAVWTSEEKARLAAFPEAVNRLRGEIESRIIGQSTTIEQLLVAFFARGHVLVTGVPGLAKTLMIRTLSELLGLEFARIQFTPDLMPSDVTGTTLIVKDEESGARHFEFRGGPIFTNLLLADEINRTPPKTQAALLEAMEESQVTAGGATHPTPSPFFVLATQNPIEQEGTYPLPVTQLDRFLFRIDIDYPDAESEFQVIAMTTAKNADPIVPVLNRAEVSALLELPSAIHIPRTIVERATRLARSTRTERRGDPSTSSGSVAEELISWGAGPRGVQAVLNSARSSALLAGRDTVTDADYEAVVLPSLRHRILLNYHAEAEKITPDDVLTRLRQEIGDLQGVEAAEATKPLNRWRRFLRAIGDPNPPIRGSR